MEVEEDGPPCWPRITEKNSSRAPSSRSDNNNIVVDPLPISTTAVTRERGSEDEIAQIWWIEGGPLFGFNRMGQKAQTFSVSNSPEGNTKATAMASPKLAAGDGNYDFHLRRFPPPPGTPLRPQIPPPPPNLLQSVRMVFEMCKEAKGANDEMVARAFPVVSKLFQRCAAVPTLSTASTGVLLLVGPRYISTQWVQCFWKLEHLLW